MLVRLEVCIAVCKEDERSHHVWRSLTYSQACSTLYEVLATLAKFCLNVSNIKVHTQNKE
jgi:hypothetical protein